MATKQKKAAPRKRSSPSKSKKSGLSAFQRFLISFTCTTAVVFGAASYVINPQLIETLRHSPALAPYLAPYIPQSGAPSEAHAAPATHVVPAASGHNVTRFAQCPQFFPGGKAPQLPSGAHLRELCFNAFAVLYNGQTKTPFLAVERLNRAALLKARQQHRTDKFYPEARLPSAERSELADYRGSGYSRGHMAPAGDMSTPEAMAQSFSLANMVPQNQINNAGAWSKIERDTRKYAMRAQGDVFVYTGPLFDTHPPVVGHGRVMVPGHLFKLVYDASTGKSWAYVQANRADTQADAPMSYADFVRVTGLHLL